MEILAEGTQPIRAGHTLISETFGKKYSSPTLSDVMVSFQTANQNPRDSSAQARTKQDTYTEEAHCIVAKMWASELNMRTLQVI